MGAELSRKRRGKEPRTGMSESQLEEFASKSVEDIMEKNVVKAISKYLGKDGNGTTNGHGVSGPSIAVQVPKGRAGTHLGRVRRNGSEPGPGYPPSAVLRGWDKQESDEGFKTALDAFSTKPKTPKEAAAHGYPKGLAPEERSKYDEAAARIKPPKRVISKEQEWEKRDREAAEQGRQLMPVRPGDSPPTTKLKPVRAGDKPPKTRLMPHMVKENDYPPTKGERRSAKRQKAKKMKVTGSGAKNLQRIIGQKAEAAGGIDKSSMKETKVEKSVIKAIDKFIDKGIDPVRYPKEAARAKKEFDRARKEGKIPPPTAPNPMSKQRSVIKAINKFLGKQTSEVTTADPEAAKRAASRARQEAGVGKPMPSPFVSRTPDPLTGKKPPKKPKPSWSAVERPEGAQRTSAGGGGGMVAFGKKKEKQLVKAISTYLKEDTPKYNKKAVDTAIKRDKSIGKKEAKAIHGLLRGRQKEEAAHLEKRLSGISKSPQYRQRFQRKLGPRKKRMSKKELLDRSEGMKRELGVTPAVSPSESKTPSDS